MTQSYKKLNAGIAGLPDSLLECTREPLLSDGEKVNLLFGSSNHALVAIADEFGAKVVGCVIQKLLNPQAPFEMLQLEELYPHGGDGECVQTKIVPCPLEDLHMGRRADVVRKVEKMKADLRLGEDGQPKKCFINTDNGIAHVIEKLLVEDKARVAAGEEPLYSDWLISTYDLGHSMWYLEIVHTRKWVSWILGPHMLSMRPLGANQNAVESYTKADVDKLPSSKKLKRLRQQMYQTCFFAEMRGLVKIFMAAEAEAQGCALEVFLSQVSENQALLAGHFKQFMNWMETHDRPAVRVHALFLRNTLAMLRLRFGSRAAVPALMESGMLECWSDLFLQSNDGNGLKGNINYALDIARCHLRWNDYPPELLAVVYAHMTVSISGTPHQDEGAEEASEQSVAGGKEVIRTSARTNEARMQQANAGVARKKTLESTRLQLDDNTPGSVRRSDKKQWKYKNMELQIANIKDNVAAGHDRLFGSHTAADDDHVHGPYGATLYPVEDVELFLGRQHMVEMFGREMLEAKILRDPTVWKSAKLPRVQSLARPKRSNRSKSQIMEASHLARLRSFSDQRSPTDQSHLLPLSTVTSDGQLILPSAEQSQKAIEAMLQPSFTADAIANFVGAPTVKIVDLCDFMDRDIKVKGEIIPNEFFGELLAVLTHLPTNADDSPRILVLVCTDLEAVGSVWKFGGGAPAAETFSDSAGILQKILAGQQMCSWVEPLEQKSSRCEQILQAGTRTGSVNMSWNP